MSDSISTILLLPHAGHRDRVLAPHAPSCRRVAPGATLSWGTLVGEPGDVRHHVAHAGSCPVDEHVHLPLARDGAVVPEGVDRLARIRSFGRDETEAAFRDALKGYPGSITAIRRWFGVLGTLVLLNKHGEVVDV